MKVLVTGAAGFIGSHVVRRLVRDGHETYALVRNPTRARRLDEVRDRIHVVVADLDDTGRTTSLVRDVEPDAIIHLAWYAEPGRYRHAVAENIASLVASADLLAAAAACGCPRMVLGGTCLERSAAAERSIYEAAKAALHSLSEGFAGSGLSVACGHVHYLYGPDEDERRVIPSVIRALLAGEPIATTSGLQRRDYLHVADVASAFVGLATTFVTGGVDICSGSLVTLAEVLRLVGQATGRPDLLRLGDLAAPPDDGYGAAGDPRSLEGTGWRPTYGLTSGIAETIAWWNARQEART